MAEDAGMMVVFFLGGGWFGQGQNVTHEDWEDPLAQRFAALNRKWAGR